MPQLTIYLDEGARKLVERAAAAQGVSRNRWIVEAIHRQASADWPGGFRELAGRFPDFPLREAGGGQTDDLPRHGE